MSILGQVKGFFRAFRSSTTKPNDPSGSSLAKTLKDSTHVGGRGAPRAGTRGQHKIVTKGHDSYTKSFKKK